MRTRSRKPTSQIPSGSPSLIRNSPRLLLVHGVGHHDPGVIQSIVSKALGKAGMPQVAATEFNWDGLFTKERPSNPFLDYPDMALLGRAFWTASWIGIDSGPISPWKFHLLRGGWSVLTAASALWMLVAIGWLLACGASMLTSPVPPIRVGLPWSSYWLPPVPPDLLAQAVPSIRVLLTLVSESILTLAAVLTALTWVTTPLPFRCALRLGVFQLLWFPVYVLGILPTVLFSLAMASFMLALISTLANLKFEIEVPDGTTWNIGPGVTDIGVGALLALVLAAVAVSLGWALWRGLRPIIDVVRYLGDRELRGHVQERFLSTVADLTAESSRIIVAAHSLGTVIAADSLLSHPDTWTKFASIDLVTAGSPLHRLMARFFPSAYPQVCVIADMVTRAYPSLRWANVYRPTDYVGGSLPAPQITNRCLLSSAWRTHSNYWGDSYAIRWIVGQVGLTRAEASDSISCDLPASVSIEQRLRSTQTPRRAVAWLLPPIAVIGCAGIIWSQFYWTPHIEQKHLAYWQELTEREGVRVVVDAVPGSAIAQSREGPDEYQMVAFYYRVDGRVYGAESKVDWLPYATSRFPHVDWSRLRTDVDASEQRRLAVEVVYARREPRIFVVPKYTMSPSYYGAGRIAFYVLRTIVLLGCWGVWCVGLWMLLDGLAPADRTIKSSSTIVSRDVV